ncbi:Peroxidase [Rhynchospora pubera]|uniref:Peroxidase n=1 Tax=Rhynchospora pubera TaxID=906938 RepID=A0AAV8FFC3_9POAL|nr:Peroxidase [Rhynchospora pubera]
MESRSLNVVLVPLASLILLLGLTSAQLSVDYYSKTCPGAEEIVRKEMIQILSAAPSLAGPFLRLHFHDCFVRGCDGSVLLDSTSGTKAEKDAKPNLTLRGFGSVERVKAKLEKACPNTVSCADVLALMARDAVWLSKGPTWPVWLGRKDGRISLANETKQLPPPKANLTQLIQMFSVKGLDLKDIVVLSGGHTIGTAHCSSISDRLYNFTGLDNLSDVDPFLDMKYITKLRSKCSPTDTKTLIEMDPGSFKTFDNSYYKLVAKRRSAFHSDWALLTNSFTRDYVLKHANGFESEFFQDFADSMIKMGNVDVLTGSQGEIRKTCSVVNY